MEIGNPKPVRFFGKKEYVLAVNRPTKTLPEKRQKSYKARKWLARLVKSGNQWCLYVRSEMRKEVLDDAVKDNEE